MGARPTSDPGPWGPGFPEIKGGMQSTGRAQAASDIHREFTELIKIHNWPEGCQGIGATGTLEDVWSGVRWGLVPLEGEGLDPGTWQVEGTPEALLFFFFIGV